MMKIYMVPDKLEFKVEVTWKGICVQAPLYPDTNGRYIMLSNEYLIDDPT